MPPYRELRLLKRSREQIAEHGPGAFTPRPIVVQAVTGAPDIVPENKMPVFPCIRSC